MSYHNLLSCQRSFYIPKELSEELDRIVKPAERHRISRAVGCCYEQLRLIIKGQRAVTQDKKKAFVLLLEIYESHSINSTKIEQ